MKFKVGDVVKIVGSTRGDNAQWDYTKGFKNIWMSYMDETIGQTGVITSINRFGVELDTREYRRYPPQALELFTEEMKIQKDKKYQTVEGNYPARVVCTDVSGNLNCIVLVKEETVLRLNECGEDSNGCKIIEEVPEIDWSKVKIDTPIWVKYGYGYVPRHFAEFKCNSVYFYNYGCSSHTSSGTVCVVTDIAVLTNPNETT